MSDRFGDLRRTVNEAAEPGHGEPFDVDILCLEDDARDADLARHALQQSISIRAWRVVSTRAAFIGALAERTPDLILADYSLPDIDGPEALRIAHERCPEVPFIFLSGTIGEERAIETLKLGATDYVIKDRLARLAPAVHRAISEARVLRSRTAAQTALAAQGAVLKRIVDAIPDLIYAVDRDGRITMANHAVLRMLKRKSQTVMGRPLKEFGGLLGAQFDDAEDQRLMQARRALTEREARLRDSDGAERCHLFSKLPLTDPATGAVNGLLVVSRDITDSRLLEREVLEVTEREQRRVGSDLHDGLGQDLTGLGLMIKGLESELRRENSQHLPQVKRIGEVLRDAFASAHSLARALAPTNLDRGDIMVAIEQLARHCSGLFGVPCEAHGDGKVSVNLSDSAAAHLYRIAQEATVNAAKHASASRIVIALSRTGADLTLAIIDDGIGFDAERAESRVGMGLRTMAYRARMLGGSLRTVRGPNGGTRVECRFPIKQNQAAA